MKSLLRWPPAPHLVSNIILLFSSPSTFQTTQNIIGIHKNSIIALECIVDYEYSDFLSHCKSARGHNTHGIAKTWKSNI